MAETLRLFVAIELPHEVREALGRLQDDLRRRGLEKLRWVRPEGIHLTLKFLGETPAARVAEIAEALAEAVSGVVPFDLELGSVDTFRGRMVPRVIWVGLSNLAESGDFRPEYRNFERLRELQSRVEAGLTPLGFPREEHGFTAHLTLARVRHDTAVEMTPRIRSALADWESLRALTKGVRIGIEEVSLMRSILGSGGAVYERLAAFPLVRAS